MRGVAGAGNESGRNEHIARSGKTLTAVGARFGKVQRAAAFGSAEPGTSDKIAREYLQIAAIFWLDGTSSAVADLKRLWIFSTTQEPGFDDWLELHHGGGARDLKQLGRTQAGIQVFDSKKAYLAQLRRFFDVGENAFTLLNRAAGLKQLNSIDEIFRELVLDDHSAFTRAAEVAAEFDDLSAIHDELETARRQQQSLLPIEKEHRHYQACADRYRHNQILQRSLPLWFAEHSHRLWQAHAQILSDGIRRCETQSKNLASQLDRREKHAAGLLELYLQAGGASVEQLGELIAKQKSILATCQRNATDHKKLVAFLSLEDGLSHDVLARNQVAAAARREIGQGRLDQAKQKAWEEGAARQNQTQELNTLREELAAANARPDSNIPPAYLDFKADLASALAVDESTLPYVAELVEVNPNAVHWRGAIERAIGGHRLRMLVPPAQIKQALRWVNQRHNRLHIRLLEAEAPSSGVNFFDDGFTRKLNFKVHPHCEAVKRLLAGIDRHCVVSTNDLQDIPHGLTEQGLMSGKRGYFEKQDQRRLDQDWMTGFDNKDRLASLKQKIIESEKVLNKLDKNCVTAQLAYDAIQQELQFLQRLLELRFEDVDLDGATQSLEDYQRRLQLLQSPDSDVEKARQQWLAADEARKQLQTQLSETQTELQVVRNNHIEANKKQERAMARIGEGLSDQERQLASAFFTEPGDAQRDELDELERGAASELQLQSGQVSDQLASSERQLSVLMERAKKVDTGALSEVGSELTDVTVYLERLRILAEEALPEKLQRFLDYLNQSSDQGVTQLLGNIDNEVSIVEERIDDLNNTMRRVDFQPGHYLRLEPRRVVHESLRTLQQAQRHLRVAALQDDEGESHYKALANMVQLLRDASDRKKTLGARALLDPRYRLQFAVSVIERDSGVVIETRTGSQGGSGGEKEIIASYILTASLSYALCPDGSSAPLFGTVVLDEAFSKSSHAVAGRIISALREFGLHPLFITPNKEMRLLRAHTRSAVLIHRKGLSATMTSLSWEELEEQAQRRVAQKTVGNTA